MIIYKVTNTITSEIYIGQTIKTLDRRWGDHCSLGSNCRFLSRAIQKYGKENFTIEQIDSAESMNELNEKEIHWIGFYNCMAPNGYNLKGGGDNGFLSQDTKDKIGKSNLGKKRTPESRQLMREKQLGKKHSPETIEKRRQSLIGRKRPDMEKRRGIPRNPEHIKKAVETRKLNGTYKHTNEAKEKMSKSHTGKILSVETKKKMSVKSKGRKKSPETLIKMRLARKGIPTGRKLSKEEITRRETTKARKRLLKVLRSLLDKS